MDQLDRTLIELFAAEPRVGVLEASRRLGVARGTVQARLDRLQRTGVVSGWGPELEPAALDHPVTAFLTLEIRQARRSALGAGTTPSAGTWPPSPSCSRRARSPARATCGAGSWRAPTPTSSG